MKKLTEQQEIYQLRKAIAIAEMFLISPVKPFKRSFWMQRIGQSYARISLLTGGGI